MAGEKNKPSTLLAPSRVAEKSYKIDEHVVAVVGGLTSDANILVQQSRVDAQRYTYTYQEPIPVSPPAPLPPLHPPHMTPCRPLSQVEQLVRKTCNAKQTYTQYGGLRPFGVSFLFAGWDDHFGYQVCILLRSSCSSCEAHSLHCFFFIAPLQLYQTDPSGNYSGWKATCIGQNNQVSEDASLFLSLSCLRLSLGLRPQAGKGVLKSDYEEGLDMTAAIKLAVKVLVKSMDATATTADKLEFVVLAKDGDKVQCACSCPGCVVWANPLSLASVQHSWFKGYCRSQRWLPSSPMCRRRWGLRATSEQLSQRAGTWEAANVLALSSLAAAAPPF